MKIKNKIILISLILFVLFSISCVSATQDIELNDTVEADDVGVSEVLSSCDTKIQSNESNHVDSQMNVLSYYNVKDDAASDNNVNKNDAVVDYNVDESGDVADILGASNAKKDVTFVAPDRTLYLEEISKGYTYPIILKDVDGNTLANKKVYLYLNGEKYSGTTDNKGWAYFNLIVKNTGVYKVNLKFGGDAEYNSLSAYSVATVKVITDEVTFVAPNRTLSIEEISKGYTYPVILKDVKGNPLAKKTVYLYINGEKYTATTDNKGWAYFDISIDKTGKYKVTLKFAGDGHYSSLSAYSITTVKVEGIDVSFVAPNRSLYLDEISGGYSYPVILKDANGNPLAKKTVYLYINGEKYTATTDNKGWAYFNIAVDKVGKYKVTLKFASDGYYNSLSSYSITTIEVVVKKNVKFVAYDKKLKISEIAGGYVYTLILKDVDGKALANKKVTLSFNGKTQTAMTDSKGWAYFTITANRAGVYGVTLEFPGDFYYYPNSSPNYRTVTVLNDGVIFVTDDRNIPLNEIYFGYNYPVLLLNTAREALANKKVTLTFNGKTQTATTDANGICYFNIVYQKKGSVGLTIKFAGDSYYNAGTCTKTINIVDSTNPYGNKAKKVWINADSGSNDMKNEVANLLRKLGWEVYVDGTGPGYHYPGYFDVTKDYQVYITLYNGFCAGTIREAYSSSIQNTLKAKGVQLVVMWDTRTWTNPQGMAPYRYGDFTGYDAKRAWDDDFSKDDPSIKNVGQWLKVNDAKYCANPTAEGLLAQFSAGGYFAYTGT